MNRACDRIVCMPMFNSYGLLDRVLTGNGHRSRPFVRISDLAAALTACGIESDLLADQLLQLEAGECFEVPATQSQMKAFYECSYPEMSSENRVFIN